MTDAVFFARLTRASDAITRAANAPNRRKLRQARRRFNAALRGISLEGYVEWCNRDAEGFALAPAASWRERGITTAWDLGRLLDAAHQRNLEKERRYAAFEEDGEEDSSDYDDGQPDEAQEWHDYDPDC